MCDRSAATAEGWCGMRRPFALVLAAAVVAALLPGALPATAAEPDTSVFPIPTVTGPIASDVGDPAVGHTFMASDLLANRGYVEEEFFYSGLANRYTATVAGGIGSRPTPSVTADIVSSGHPYTTRMVVRRPADAADFNGTVIVEWQNATSNYDVEAYWFRAHEHLIRSGYAWVGITAQNTPINHATLGLKAFDANRYGSLDLTGGGVLTSGDHLSFDAYGQGIQAIRHAGVLGDLQDGIETVVAAGVSQSAGRVSVFTNAIQTRGEPIADAVLLLIGGEKMRDDLPIPVFKVYSESENATAVFNTLQPDTSRMRTWHATGTTHSDWQSLIVRYPELARDQPTVSFSDTCAQGPTRSRIPERYAWASATDHLVEWAREGVQPPTAPALFRADGTFERDALGNAVGGLRLAPVEVPIALAAPGCGLNGLYQPFSAETLAGLYPTRDSYLAPFRAAVAQNVADGYVVAEDAAEMLAVAESSIIGLGLVCEEFCANVSQFPLRPSTQSLRDQTASYYLIGGAELVDLLDRATLAVATGTTYPGQRAASFADARARLIEYRDAVAVALSQGRASSGQAAVLTSFAEVLIAGLAPDVTKPETVLVAPTTAGPYPSLTIQLDATDNRGLKRIVANVYRNGTLVKSTQTAAHGAKSASHATTVTLPDGDYVLRYNAEDLVGLISTTRTFAFTIDATSPTVSVKDGAQFTAGSAGTYSLLSVKLYDAGKIDKVVINGVVKDLVDNAWSDVNGLRPGVFGAVAGANTMVVHDVAGNTREFVFTLTG
ncbi:MAG: alpha/beta hydrolase domain-containing protein [Microbacterium sp.]